MERQRDPNSGASSAVPTKKSLVTSNVDADEKARTMMEKVNLEPVEVAKQKGRLRLDLKTALSMWNPNREVVSVQEKVHWLINSQEPLVATWLIDWMRQDDAKMTIDDECNFCDPSIVHKVIDMKALIDDLDKNEVKRARTRSNPYGTIRGAFFINRAATKMADMDKACDFMFTQPAILKPGELLYFADVCAGPGGFSEYVLWRKKWRAKGFGLTLAASNDFDLDNFNAGSPESFHTYYGPNGDGDVCSPENQEGFRHLIMQQTEGKGVHFMMSDGRFSVEGKENIREILSKRLYLCQCLVALMIVRQGGNFVTSIFDLFTPFSAGLVYLMYRCFESVSIYKPKCSRRANSERYLICKGKLDHVQNVVKYFSRVNLILRQNMVHHDVTELVPYTSLVADVKFFRYLKNSNDAIGTNQIGDLLKIAAFTENSSLFEYRQSKMKKQCLDHWELPDKIRTISRDEEPEKQLRRIVKSSSLRFLASKSTKLTTSNVVSTFLRNPYDWYCVPCGSDLGTDKEKAATFYMGKGRTKTYRYDEGYWTRVKNLELPPDTLVYAEMVYELRGEYRNQLKTFSLHIIDAYFLGSEDVSQKCLHERIKLTKLFCEALWKPTNSEYIRVRAKTLLHLPQHNLDEMLSLKPHVMKNGTNAEAYEPASNPSSYDNCGDQPYYYIPNSFILLKGTAQNWSRHISRTNGFSYYHNCQNKVSLYDKDRPATADASFPESMENRIVWQWRDDPALTIDTICRLIRKKCLS